MKLFKVNCVKKKTVDFKRNKMHIKNIEIT